jgi:arginase
MGPAAIRYSGLHEAVLRMGLPCRDLGNIDVPVGDLPEDNPKARYKKAIADINGRLSDAVADSLAKGHRPIILGGDHSIAAGSLLGTQRVFGNIGVIWMDAHGDFNNEETTLSGNLHGMSLAAAVGAGVQGVSDQEPRSVPFVDPCKVAIVGARSLDDGEICLLRRFGVTVFTMEDIDAHGMNRIMRCALDVAEAGTDAVHASFDLDVVTPSEAPGVGTPVQGGLTYREAHLAAEMIAASPKLRAIDLVELNPILDHANQTGELAVSLICSMLGKRIFHSAGENI